MEISIIKNLFDLNEIHEEYQDNGNHYVLDVTKNENTVNISITNLGNKDKVEFEEWLKKIDDDLFTEIFSYLNEDIVSLYQSDRYQEAINKFKTCTKEIINQKIKDLQSIID